LENVNALLGISILVALADLVQMELLLMGKAALLQK
jgi:hypothetical protein